MSTTILPIRSPSFPAVERLPSVQPPGGPSDGARATSFSELISSSVRTVEQATQNATNAAQEFLSGQNEDLHTVAIAEQKAEITSELFLQVRNKAVSAYQEIMRMQL